MPDTRPLGVFDSGVGGLTVVRALKKLMPNESIIYLGDTARVPYGNKSKEAVQRYALQDSAFLVSRQVKTIVVACNTATAFALDALQHKLDLPVIGVVEPGVEAALGKSQSGKIGIIGTAGTIYSQAYQSSLEASGRDLEIIAKATPLLVPLIEENWLEHTASRLIVEEYLDPFLQNGIDTLVLACTHYPMIQSLLQEIVGDSIALVDSASTCAQHTQRMLQATGIEAPAGKEGIIEAFLTDVSGHFNALAERFLENPLAQIHQISVD
ncbi:MAG: glutamate racemase [Verrucomicrobiota bacterium]